MTFRQVIITDEDGINHFQTPKGYNPPFDSIGNKDILKANELLNSAKVPTKNRWGIKNGRTTQFTDENGLGDTHNKELSNGKSSLGRVRNDGRWHSRGSDWSTPQDLYDELDNEFHFTLDVCASDWNKKHTNYFSEKDNALEKDWGNNICWMNPPYGKVLNNWMKKAYESNTTVVCLVPSATDTAWWHDYVMKGEIRYLRGRPRFITPEGTWQQTFSPSVIVIFKGKL